MTGTFADDPIRHIWELEQEVARANARIVALEAIVADLAFRMPSPCGWCGSTDCDH